MEKFPTSSEESKDRFVPFKDLRTHEEFGKHYFNKGELYSINNQEELFQSGENKDYIIKALASKRNEVMLEIKDAHHDHVFRYAAELKQKYSELETIFGVSVAPTSLVVGKDINGLPELYSVTEKVDGLELYKITSEELTKLPDTFIPDLAFHFENLLQYIEVKFLEKKRFMADIFINEQYVYGKTKNESREKLYLVDVEPQYLEIENMSEVELWEEHLRFLQNLLCIMYELEEKWMLSKGTFSKSKFVETYKNLMAHLPEGVDINHPFIQGLRQDIEELL